MNDTKDITTAAIERIAQQLTNLGCVFRIDREGITLHDTMPVQEPEKKKKAPRRDIESTGLYAPVDHMQPGEVVLVRPLDGMTLTDLQGLVTSRCVNKFGKQAVMTLQRKEKHALEVLRLC